MADTLREPTAFLRSENLRNLSAMLSRLDILGFSPDHLSALYPTCQEADRLRLLIHESLISKIGDAVDMAYASHRETGGSTVDVFDGDLTGRRLFALSVFPERTVELHDSPIWRQVFDFTLQNLDLVSRKGCAIGTWYDRNRGLHVLDIVVFVSNRDAALELGKCFDQQSVYDLERRQEIEIPYRPLSIPNVVGGGNG